MENSKKNLKELQTKVFAAYEDAVKRVGEAVLNFPWENEELYSRWCAQTFYLVGHTTRFLCFTASQFSLKNDDYHKFCLSHLREETGHELLALRDLESFDKDIKDYPSSFEADLMIQSQYYWIQKNPFTHFGFFWVLERISVSYVPQIIPKIQKAHGKGCTQFLDLHAAEDIQHVKSITEKVNQIPAEALEELAKNIEQTGVLYVTMLKNLQNNALYLKNAPKNRSTKAA